MFFFLRGGMNFKKIYAPERYIKIKIDIKKIYRNKDMWRASQVVILSASMSAASVLEDNS